MKEGILPIQGHQVKSDGWESLRVIRAQDNAHRTFLREGREEEDEEVKAEEKAGDRKEEESSIRSVIVQGEVVKIKDLTLKVQKLFHLLHSLQARMFYDSAKR